MGRVIVVTSGKGGVGKTTITANVGITLAKMGSCVCLIDGDLGLNNLDVVMGVENYIVYDILDILRGKCRISQALIKDKLLSNLYILSSIKQDSSRLISKDAFYGLVMDLEGIFDYVLIDAPAGIDYGFERAICPAGEMVVVVTPTLTSLRDAKKVIDKASASIFDMGIVINRVNKKLERRGEVLKPQEIAEVLNVPIFGKLHEDESLNVGYNIKSLLPSSKYALEEIKTIANNLKNNTTLKLKNRIIGGR